MYETFYALKHKPFSLLPDPEFLFLSDKHAVALSLLEYSLTGQAGFCVITGEIGSGKTTLVRAFLKRIDKNFTVGLISNTHSSFRDVASWVLIALGQKPLGVNPAETYQELMTFLISEYGAGRQCIVIVDEAQNLTIDALEELRLLSNINSGKDLLLQMVLVGQPELLEKLKRPELVQFAQRIAISHHLAPLSYPETRRYIQHRLKIAGAGGPIFTEMAMGAVQYFSGGVPRLINSICDLALVYGFADGKALIDETIVLRVISDRQSSGIAPFARSESPNDPSILVEIGGLARAAEELDRDTEAGLAAAAVNQPADIPAAHSPPSASLSTPLPAPLEIVPPPTRPVSISTPVPIPSVEAVPALPQETEQPTSDLYFADTLDDGASALSNPKHPRYVAPVLEYSQTGSRAPEQAGGKPWSVNGDAADLKSWPSITGRKPKLGNGLAFGVRDTELPEPRRPSWWRRSFLRN
jgi:type II secretory pathway predicted ATPase ExeA